MCVQELNKGREVGRERETGNVEKKIIYKSRFSWMNFARTHTYTQRGKKSEQEKINASQA